MRTLRELAGWGVLLALWAIPLAAGGAALLWLVEDVSVLWPVLGLLLVLAWPGLRRLGRAWRTSPYVEHAEADGRRPVLLIHRSADHELPWYRRLFVFQSGYRRAARDQSWREALVSGFAALGPALPLARPFAPAASGPTAMLRPDPTWGPGLRRQLKTARLAVIVLDATNTCRDDIALAFEVLGPRRTALIMPASVDPALAAAWPALQGVVPGLPAFDSHALAFRFDPNGTVLAMTDPRGFSSRKKQLTQPSRMLFSHERDAPPAPPSWAAFAMVLPTIAGFVSTLAIPVMLEFEGVRLDSDLLIIGGITSVALGITLSVMGRRMFRLVTANELPFVVVACLPWLLATVGPWLVGDWARNVHRLDTWLEIITAGAAFSAPLLLATSLMLSASALARRSPNRQIAYVVFGLAALAPFATLIAMLSDSGTYIFGIAQFLLAGGVAAGVAVVAASGDGERPHGPLPLGAGATAALTVGAWATVVTSQQWRTLLDFSGSPEQVRRLASQAPALVAFGESWVWFLVAIPLLVGLIASLQRGRGSRTAVGNVWALAPMIVVFGLVSTAQAGARTAFSHAYVRAGGLMFARAVPAGSASVDLASLGTGRVDPRPLDAVLTADETFVEGERLIRNEAGIRRMTSLVRGARTGAINVRIGVDRNAQAGDVERMVQAFNAGGRNCALVDIDGWSVSVRSAPRQPSSQDRAQYALRLSPGSYALAGTDGSSWQETDLAGLGRRLQMLREMQPDLRLIYVTSDPGTDAEVMMAAVAMAANAGLSDIVLGAPAGYR